MQFPYCFAVCFFLIFFPLQHDMHFIVISAQHHAFHLIVENVSVAWYCNAIPIRVVFGLFSVLVCLSASLLHCQKLSPIQYKFVLALYGVLKGLYSYPYRTQSAHRYNTNTIRYDSTIPRNAQTLYYHTWWPCGRVLSRMATIILWSSLFLCTT